MKAKDFAQQEATKISSRLKDKVKQEVITQITNARQNLLPLGFFEIYDVMQAAASSDGVTMPNVSKHYWNHNAAAPYTDIEAKMLRDSYTALGIPWDTSILDLSVNAKSKPDGEQSPVVAFKGYPK